MVAVQLILFYESPSLLCSFPYTLHYTFISVCVFSKPRAGATYTSSSAEGLHFSASIMYSHKYQGIGILVWTYLGRHIGIHIILNTKLEFAC